MERKRRNNQYSKAKKIKIVKQVCSNYATGLYTLSSICENAGVPERTFRSWIKTYENFEGDLPEKWQFFAELAELWSNSCDKCSEHYRKGLVEKAERGLEKRVSGYQYEEVKETLKEVVNSKNGEREWNSVSKVVITKYNPPHVGAIQFVLNTLGGSTYCKDVAINNNYIETDPYMMELRNMTDDELTAEIARLEAKESL